MGFPVTRRNYLEDRISQMSQLYLVSGKSLFAVLIVCFLGLL
jgi:hypothetical protein